MDMIKQVYGFMDLQSHVSAGMGSRIRRNGIAHPPEWHRASAGMIPKINNITIKQLKY